MPMHELTGKIAGVSLSFEGKPLVTLEMDERRSALDMVNALRGMDRISIKLGKYKVKRSLDANSYLWLLIGKIAEKTNVPKAEVYREAIRELGGNYDVVCIKTEAADSLRNTWERNGIGWFTEVMNSKINGCTNVLLYYGSSCYDVEQMSRLIDSIVQDCKALGIETKQQEEIDSLLSSWGGKNG